jgi:transcription-repair coupling factor (superfamily II helicase)
MDQLDKYSAGGEPKKLSKIGGADFGAVKERVKKQLKEMAFSLLKLYAERETRAGFVYKRDEELQKEFESKFPFVETEDQLSAIVDVKNDMEAGKVMDRLICGDVGFGKTEVALRSAFKAVVNGKQVAFIAPTTILARQHYNTLVNRMSEFGVRVAILDRFVSSKEVKETLKNLSLHKTSETFAPADSTNTLYSGKYGAKTITLSFSPSTIADKTEQSDAAAPAVI